jgi:hypothetical protein
VDERWWVHHGRPDVLSRFHVSRRFNVKRSLVSKLAAGSAVAALALGAVACDDIDADGDLDPGMEDGGDDLGDDL